MWIHLLDIYKRLNDLATIRAAHRPFDGDGRRSTAVNLQLKSQNGNGRVKNGRRRVVRPFAQPFDVYYFFHNFYFVFRYPVDVIRDIVHEY